MSERITKNEVLPRIGMKRSFIDTISNGKKQCIEAISKTGLLFANGH